MSDVKDLNKLNDGVILLTNDKVVSIKSNRENSALYTLSNRRSLKESVKESSRLKSFKESVKESFKESFKNSFKERNGSKQTNTLDKKPTNNVDLFKEINEKQSNNQSIIHNKSIDKNYRYNSLKDKEDSIIKQTNLLNT